MVGLQHPNIELADTLAGEHLYRLIDQRNSRNDEKRLLPLGPSTHDKLRGQQCLAEPCACLHHYMLQIVAHCLSQAVQCLMLIWSQRTHYDSSSDSWGVSWALAIRATSSGTIFTSQSRFLSITHLTASSVSITSSFSD